MTVCFEKLKNVVVINCLFSAFWCKWDDRLDL